MKTLSLISMIIVCSLLASGTESAPQSESHSAASSTSDRDHSVHKINHVVVDKKKPQPYTKTAAKPRGERDIAEQGRPHTGAVSSPTELPPQSANGRPSAPQPNSSTASQPFQNRAVPVFKGGPLRSQPASRELPVQPPTVASTAALSHNDVRHRGPNSSVLGGAAASKPTNTASISGSTVHRKP
jgi:hypothetical protein